MAKLTGRLICATALLAICAACDESGDDPAPVASVSPAQPVAAPAPPAAKGKGPRRDALAAGEPTGRWRGRPERLLTAAVEQASPGVPQKAKLEALAKQLDLDAGADEQVRTFRTELAESAKAGSLDTKKLEQRVQAIEQSAKQEQVKTAKLLNELHGVLDAVQRKALVAKLRQEQEASFMQHKPPPSPDRDKGRQEREKQRVERLARELELNEAQAKQLAQIEAKWRDSDPNTDFHAIRAQGDQRLGEVLTAFEKDTFDASRFKLLPVTVEGSAKRAQHELQRVKALLPVLEPGQRVKLGEHMGRTVGRARNRPLPEASPASISSAR